MSILAKLARFWLVLVLLVAGGYVAIYNQASIVVNIPGFVPNRGMPLYVALTCAFLGGGIVASLYFALDNVKQGMAIKKLTRINNRLRADAQPPSASTAAVPEIAPQAP